MEAVHFVQNEVTNGMILLLYACRKLQLIVFFVYEFTSIWLKLLFLAAQPTAADTLLVYWNEWNIRNEKTSTTNSSFSYFISSHSSVSLVFVVCQPHSSNKVKVRKVENFLNNLFFIKINFFNLFFSTKENEEIREKQSINILSRV